MLMNKTSQLSLQKRPAASTRPIVSTNAVALKPLPYAVDALEPHMSKSTFEVRIRGVLVPCSVVVLPGRTDICKQARISRYHHLQLLWGSVG